MKPINLAKCKIGRRVKLRNGDISQLVGIDEEMTFPYSFSNIKTADLTSHTQDGRFLSVAEDYDYDIIAILPLPKKKAKTATHMGQKVDISENRRSIKAMIQNLKNAIKHLEGLI